MYWTARQYALPVLFALALHAALVVWLQGAWTNSDNSVRVIKPRMIHSTLLVLEPKAKPAPRVKPPPKVQPKPTPRESQPQQAKPERTEPVVKPVAEPKIDPAIELARQQELERQKRLQVLADSSFLNSLEDESADLAENTLADDEAAAQSYRYGIYQLIVANWSRPPSARNDMQTLLQVELVPTGDVVAVMLVESSGSGAFDQSAEAAVRKARRFEVPSESAVFEKYFRRFTLLFKPEDLLR